MLKGATVLLGILLVLPGLVAAEGSGEKEQPAAESGTVEYLEGEVTLDGSAAEVGDRVPEGTVVETGDTARCDIVFGGKNVIRVYADTRVRLDLPAGSAEMAHGAIGAVFDRLKSLVTNGNGFTFASPTVVAGVRGTVFYLRTRNPGETYFCTCHGRVDLEDPKGGHRHETENTNHGAYWYRSTEEGYRTAEETLLFHDSAMMDDIAERIGVTIPWGK
jgi:hypothetical protein